MVRFLRGGNVDDRNNLPAVDLPGTLWLAVNKALFLACPGCPRCRLGLHLSPVFLKLRHLAAGAEFSTIERPPAPLKVDRVAHEPSTRAEAAHGAGARERPGKSNNICIGLLSSHLALPAVGFTRTDQLHGFTFFDLP
ncbi:MAG TPA: hypothetical protein VIK18_25195 [Pirellulales bacterium]